MPLPTIVHAGHPVLRMRAAEVSPDQLATRGLRDLINAMTSVMRAAPGVGLAAPQIGVSTRVIVLEDTEERIRRLDPKDRALREREPFPLRVVVNPVIRIVPPSTAPRRAPAVGPTFFEGCLSVPGYTALVERSRAVEVTGLDADGAPIQWHVQGWPARIVQHEVDHLDGVLYVDRMLTRSLVTAAMFESEVGRMSIEDVRRTLRV